MREPVWASVRRAIFWMHLAVGVTAGLVILVVSELRKRVWRIGGEDAEPVVDTAADAARLVA